MYRQHKLQSFYLLLTKKIIEGKVLQNRLQGKLQDEISFPKMFEIFHLSLDLNLIKLGNCNIEKR